MDFFNVHLIIKTKIQKIPTCKRCLFTQAAQCKLTHLHRPKLHCGKEGPTGHSSCLSDTWRRAHPKITPPPILGQERAEHRNVSFNRQEGFVDLLLLKVKNCRM